MTDSGRIDKVRFLLVNALAIAIVFEVSPAFIILPALSIVLLALECGFNLRNITSRISNHGYFLTLLFLIHAAWFMREIIDTLSTRYLERTLPFLLFPLMISSSAIDGRRLTVTFRTFIAAVSGSYLLSLLAAAYHYKYSVPRWGRASDFFFHEQFTMGLFNIHPTYYSLLGCVATLLALITLTGIWRGAAVAFLTVVILLIDARSVLVIQLLVIFSFILWSFSRGFSLKRLLILLISGVVLFGLMRIFSSIYDYPHRKLLVNLDSAWKRSYAPDIFDGDGGIVMRMAIWRSAGEIIRDHPVVGVGLGYEEQNLGAAYKRNGYVYLTENVLNAHNQLLSYLIGIGVLGLTLLAIVYAQLMREAFKAKCRVYFVFLGIFACVALTESVFNRLLGISLFAFFNTLIMLKLARHDK
jgi:O-antigen ligase